MTLPHLVFYGLACFRLSLMLSEDGGPYKLFAKLRSKLKKEAKHNPALRKSDMAAGLSCIKCSSVYVAGAIATWVYYHDSINGWILAAGDVFLACMALSALAILVNRLLPAK